MSVRAKPSRRELPSPPPQSEDYDDMRELEQALAIDEYELADARKKQPELFYRVAKAYALTISRRDAAKQSLQDAEARADLDVRRDAQQEERKITEGEVRAMVQVDPAVVQTRAVLSRLSEEVGQLGALKEAFQDRSYALKDLISLYVANYFQASEGNVGGIARDRMGAEGRRAMSEARLRQSSEKPSAASRRASLAESRSRPG